MTLRVEVEPELLAWAIERSGADSVALHGRFNKLESWLNRSVKPTLKQVEAFARATHTPVGFLFLHEPPEERIPIPDYRTMANTQLSRPSANLLDTIYICQQRQDWYRDYARNNGLRPLEFVGSVDRRASVERVAEHIRDQLGFDLDARRSMRTWEDALRSFIAGADAAGIMVMCNGIVLNNTRRKLSPEEFRGFALTDDLAPLVFVNGADTKSAQMFTLAHELAHLWLGETALSSADIGGREEQAIERWCNAVAAELLVPLSVFSAELGDEDLSDALQRLARLFKVSTLVILRRMRDADYLSSEEYSRAYGLELEKLMSLPGSSGGSFYLSQPNKLSKRFASALVVSTLEGQTLYRDAMKMLGVRKVSTFNELGRSLGGYVIVTYLLDSNVFIQASNLHYGLDFCPAFWEWLKKSNQAGKVFSISQVLDELTAGNDELAGWAKLQGDVFYKEIDAATLAKLTEVAEWVQLEGYEAAAINTFLQVADYYLISYALAHGHIVVTHEVPANTTRKIKIPNVCVGVGVGCINPYAMLRRERAKFVLGRV